MRKEKGQNQEALTQNDKRNGSTPIHPLVTGQCAEILSILRQGPTLSLTLTADYAIPETADTRPASEGLCHRHSDSRGCAVPWSGEKGGCPVCAWQSRMAEP